MPPRRVAVRRPSAVRCNAPEPEPVRPPPCRDDFQAWWRPLTAWVRRIACTVLKHLIPVMWVCLGLILGIFFSRRARSPVLFNCQDTKLKCFFSDHQTFEEIRSVLPHHLERAFEFEVASAEKKVKDRSCSKEEGEALTFGSHSLPVKQDAPDVNPQCKKYLDRYKNCHIKTFSELGCENIVAFKYSSEHGNRMVDFAMEAAGGSIVPNSYSPPPDVGGLYLSFFGIIEVPLSSNSPNSLIQPGNQHGQCWAFGGTCGCIVLQLAVPVRIAAVTLGHVSRGLSFHSERRTAPKDFVILGLQDAKDKKGEELGCFRYDLEGPAEQIFAVQNPRQLYFPFVKLSVLNNYGNQTYTCVYRLQVHGIPQENVVHGSSS